MAASRRIRRFLELESASGIMLMAAAATALLVANVESLHHYYQVLLHQPIEVVLGPLRFHEDFLHFVNDGLMAVFFLLVGLEIKREVSEGELSTRAQVALPAIAAVGGMLVPALIYVAINWGDPTAIRGWAIPSATDIAFSLGCLALLGSRAPLALKVFLTAVAVVDDLGAIVIIAIAYTSHVDVVALGVALAALLVLVTFNRLNVVRMGPYFFVGVIMWFAVLESGIHATLAGVALALTIPMRDRESAAFSPLRSLEHNLHPSVAFVIVPIFAFANSGVSFADVAPRMIFGTVTLGIFFGLVVGKTIGIFVFSWLGVKTGLAAKPAGTTWVQILAVSMLCGIGFTMSLFIGNLAFAGEGAEYAVATRVGVFAASAVAALLGLAILRFVSPVPIAQVESESRAETRSVS